MKDLIIRGPDCVHVPLKLGFAEYFFHKATDIGNKIFQIDGNTEKVETYGQVKTRTTRLALGLKQLGFKPKDVSFLCCHNGSDNIIPVLATLYLGGRVSSGDPRQTADDSRYLMEQVEPQVIFVEERSVQMIEEALKGSELHPRIIVIGDSDKYLTMKKLEEPHHDEAEFTPVKQTEDDIAFILFSSGTTSAQKGIYISNRFALNCGSIWKEGGNAVPGVTMHFTSFYWIIAIAMTSFCMITESAKVVGKNISAERYLKLVSKYKITFTICSNTFTYQLTNLDEKIRKKYDTTSLISFAVGGASVQLSQLLKLRQILPHTKVTMGYGSSENGMISGFNLREENAINSKPLSSGTPVPGLELKVVDLESGKLLGPNQQGEIRVKSRYTMSGYHKLNADDVFDENGFMKIGDYGYYDEDKYVYVLGRLKEMFKYQFFQILPETIEQMLIKHPAVQEAVVFGVPHAEDNNHPGAVVTLKPNVQVTPGELIEYCHSKVADYRKLRAGLVIMDAIPKTVTGKVQRRLVRDIFIKMKSEKS
ncbi:hypothetical protein GWI33_007315 [Rhynchophorus ferrugineus]|uniref:Luciferin 4-monooxygenase-like protein n=1 Tax=Rhynchophorus ferrugineus TaxID=354439 RepID=A0A834ITD5_RHYFE|nr:hypothetical protein GWI33_007315 [Rhynchophorus ferrugineus]